MSNQTLKIQIQKDFEEEFNMNRIFSTSSLKSSQKRLSKSLDRKIISQNTQSEINFNNEDMENIQTLTETQLIN